MVLRAITSDSPGTGVRAEMAANDLLLVTEDAVVVRTDAATANDAAISALEGGNMLDIRGGVASGGIGILLGNSQSDDWDYSVKLGANAFVNSFWGSGIRASAINVHIVNAGAIQGHDGIELNGISSSDVYRSRVVNSGLIEGENNAITRTVLATEKLIVENTGTIRGGQFAFAAINVNAVEEITNKGKMIGDVWLGAGADLYDGRQGTLQGRAFGGDGDDTIYGGAGSENLNGGAGKDYIDGGAGNDNLFGDEGNDILKGGGGNDFLDGQAGNDRMEGGQGNDTYSVDAAGDVIVERAGEGLDRVAASVSHTIAANIEELHLAGNANLAGTGNNLANVVVGNAGRNVLKGMAGNDTLDGGKGADRLEGGAGNDTFIVDNGGDVVTERAGEGTDTVKSSVSHTLSANVERLILTGTANINGTGNKDANILTGNAGNNTLKGEAGNDKLVGGGGLDKLFGGSGKDTFVFNSAADSKMSAQDKIFDFSQAQGDRIDLRGIDANPGKVGDQAFSFIGKDGFNHKAGELRFDQKSGDTFVQGDLNGDGVADFGFVLDATVNLKAGDFLL